MDKTVEVRLYSGCIYIIDVLPIKQFAGCWKTLVEQPRSTILDDFNQSLNAKGHSFHKHCSEK